MALAMQRLNAALGGWQADLLTLTGGEGDVTHGGNHMAYTIAPVSYGSGTHDDNEPAKLQAAPRSRRPGFVFSTRSFVLTTASGFTAPHECRPPKCVEREAIDCDDGDRAATLIRDALRIESGRCELHFL